MASETTALPVSIASDDVTLSGDLTLPAGSRGLIVFVHGSGSSRFSSRNRYVSSQLNAAGFATLLADLLTPEEEAVDATTAKWRFDIRLLARRTVSMIDWASLQEDLADRPIGLFGASTGAAAAIVAASERRDRTSAVVSRGGRVDLAGHALAHLHAPLLMIVGSLDLPVLDLHRRILPKLACLHSLQIVPGATHLFEEPGALQTVAQSATAWFNRYLES